MTENELSQAVIGAAIEVHKELGPGLLETAYEECLAHELSLRDIPFERQKPMPIVYKGKALDCGLRLDLPVAEKLVLELKAVDQLLRIHDAQVLTYLKLSKCKLGLLLNFNVELIKDGIRRLVREL